MQSLLNINKVNARIKKNRERLELYYAREAEMLSQDGIKTYSLGSHSLSRYETDLRTVQDAIKRLEGDIAQDESLLASGGARRAVAAIPRDL